jgi:hypothetical protein
MSDACTEMGRIAQLNWVARKFSNLCLEETQIFPSNGQTDPGHMALVVRHVNRTFPFYLPNRYYIYDISKTKNLVGFCFSMTRKVFFFYFEAV